jgi:hypothetical protein
MDNNHAQTNPKPAADRSMFRFLLCIVDQVLIG